MIHEDGYIILKNILTEDDLETALISMVGDKVDYVIMKKFIDTVFFPNIVKNSHITNPHYVKFRFSNNNNSTDASLFHGDVYNHTELDMIPLYTCLCYFDNTQMELIPGSHKKNKDWSVESYNKKIVVDLARGDILIFHSNIHHRGINFDKKGDRRLLQVFDVFPDTATYNQHSSKLSIVSSTKSNKNLGGQFLYNISKYPSIIDTATFFHYILVYNDLQYKLSLMDIAPWDKNNRYISYEPAKRLHMKDINKLEDQNINIICDESVKSIGYSNYYVYIALAYLLLTVVIVFIIYILWYNTNYKKGLKNNMYQTMVSKLYKLYVF